MLVQMTQKLEGVWIPFENMGVPMKKYKLEKGGQICAFEGLLFVPWKRPKLDAR